MASLPHTLLLILLGAALLIIQKLRIDPDNRESLLNFLITLSIPFIVLSFIESHPVFWALPIVFVLVSILFRKKRLLYMVSAASFFTLLWIWIARPQQSVNIGAANHLFRIGIFVIFIWIAFQINRIYFNRLEKNEQQVKHQKLLADVSAHLSMPTGKISIRS